MNIFSKDHDRRNLLAWFSGASLILTLRTLSENLNCAVKLNYLPLLINITIITIIFVVIFIISIIIIIIQKNSKYSRFL